MVLVKITVLPMLLKVLSKSRRPYFCSVMWVLIILTNGLIFNMIMGASWATIIVTCLIEFAAATLYFYALNELEGAGGLYWGVLVLGFLAMLFLPHPNLDPPGKAVPMVTLPSGMPTTIPSALHQVMQERKMIGE